MRAKGNQGPTPAPPRRLVIAGRRRSRADQVPPDRRGKYGLTTNHGTSEHILDQRNTFNAIHDFTGGMMDWRCRVTLRTGSFSSQPNQFEAMARYNSYQTLGTWVGPAAVKPRTLGAEALGVSHPQRQDDASLGRAAAQAARHRVLHSDSGRVRAHAARKCQGSLPARRRWGILPRPESLPGADAKKNSACTTSRSRAR